MYSPTTIHQAPPDFGKVILGRTLPSLLDEACDRYPNARAFNQWRSGGWQPYSNQEVRLAADSLALGLLDLGLQRGDRVSLFMHSDVNFCIADMGTLLAGLVNVPIYLGETPDNIIYILQHSEAKALIVSDLDLLRQIDFCLKDPLSLTTLIVAEPQRRSNRKSQGADTLVATEDRDSSAQLSSTLAELNLPAGMQIRSLAEVYAKGKAMQSDQSQRQLRAAIAPDDVATIIYLAGTTGQCHTLRDRHILPISRFVNTLRHRSQTLHPPTYVCESPIGVMLTHENLSADALAAFSSIPDLQRGDSEIVLSFLPLTHIFARVMLYGHMNYGHTIAFTTQHRVVRHLKEIRPTLFATVPRLLEKVYQKILETGGHLKGLPKAIFDWALHLAQRYELGQSPDRLYALQLKVADDLLLRKWRAIFGGRLKYLLTGGAALKGDLANLFSAAGITVLQGYGLTQTSSVICCNRGEFNRAGTVGVPIAGVEIAIAGDGEILVRAPYVMKGYYKDPAATRQAIDPDGWFHTGDFGEFTPDGFLKITGYKKSLFKLSTGKYVTPERLEHHLQESSLVAHAVAVGAHRKFCAMLIFPDREQLCAQAQAMGLDQPIDSLIRHAKIVNLYQALVDAANQTLPPWSMAKRFQLINATLTVENGLLTPTGQINREAIETAFTAQINALYAEPQQRTIPADQPDLLQPRVANMQALPITLKIKP